MMWVLLACDGQQVPAGGEDSGGGGAWAEVAGAPADGLGNAVVAAGDLNGDGDPDLLAAAYLGNRVCAIFGPLAPGDGTLDSRPASCLVGEVDTDYAGYGMASVGDVTGDGFGDVMVGSIGNAEAGINAGKVYLVAGPLSPGTAPLDQAAVTTWLGETEQDFAGVRVASGGDLTGDGEPDLLVGASGFDGEGGGGGRAYLLSGPHLPGTFSLADAHSSVTGLGAPPPPPHGAFGTGDFVGDALVGATDFDGDGVDDLALGASGDGTLGLNAGKVAVFFGPVDAGAWLVTDADVTLFGEAELSYTGTPLVGAPDLTGDGRDDLLVSADVLGPGVVYIVSPAVGQASVTEAVSRFEGESEGDLFGSALATPADLDTDGVLDFAVGAPGADRAAFEAGAVWWFAGPFANGVTATSSGIAIEGQARAESFGSALDVADVGNGERGLVVGARNSNANGGFSGMLYLFDL